MMDYVKRSHPLYMYVADKLHAPDTSSYRNTHSTFGTSEKWMPESPLHAAKMSPKDNLQPVQNYLQNRPNPQTEFD